VAVTGGGGCGAAEVVPSEEGDEATDPEDRASSEAGRYGIIP
jgi:hypothetical protein